MKVAYSSYCQVDELVEKARKSGRLDGYSFGQKRDPCESLYRKFKTVFRTPLAEPTPHTSNIGMTFRGTIPREEERARSEGADLSGRRLMAVATDIHHTKQFDADALGPLGVTAQSLLHPSLSGPLSGAHAAHVPQTGDICNYNLAFGARSTYRVFRATPTSKIDILAEMSGEDIHPAYLHSMLLSENFAISCIWPAYFYLAGVSMLWNRNVLDSIKPFDPESKATWLVTDRRHGQGLVAKFTSPDFLCFHTVNAWEERQAGDESKINITCELVQWDDMDVLHSLYYKNMVSNEKDVGAFDSKYRARITGGLARYKLPGVPLVGSQSKLLSAPSIDHLTAERIFIITFPGSGDLPRINPHYALQPHRYVYSLIDRHRSSFLDEIAKTDTRTQECLVWEHDKHTPSEPIFVPTPGPGREEEDGIVLSVILDGTRSTSYLLCLDARKMEEFGRADVGRAVGLGFHGVHLPSVL